MAIPKPAIELLTEEFHQRVQRTSDKIDEFSLRSFEQRAKQQLDRNPMEAHNLLGMIYTVMGGHEEDALEHLRVAASSKNTTYMGNYGSSLATSHRFEEAVEVMAEVVEREPTHTNAIGSLVEILRLLGKFRDIAQLHVSLNLPEPMEVFEGSIKAVNFMDTYSLNDELVQRSVSSAVNLVAGGLHGLIPAVRIRINSSLRLLVVEISTPNLSADELATLSWEHKKTLGEDEEYIRSTDKFLISVN